MTDREAIEYWESFESEIDSLYLETNKAGRAELDKQRPAVKAALVALQEREERSRRCESCFNFEPDATDDPYAYYRYCPMCGRKLRDGGCKFGCMKEETKP